MQSLSRALFILLTAMMLMLAGCSKSVEGENKKWTANTTRVTELSAQYPGFKAALTARKASAQELYDAAQDASGDAQIEQLSTANTALMKGFVGQLGSIDRKLKKLRTGRIEAASKAGASTMLGAKMAAEDAQKTMDRVEATLKKGATDEASANAILKKLTGDIKTAQSALNKVIAIDASKKKTTKTTTDSKKTDGKAKTDADAKAKADAKAAADAKVAPWKCGYCDTMNDHKDHKCKTCGAAREAEKKKPAAKKKK